MIKPPEIRAAERTLSDYRRARKLARPKQEKRAKVEGSPGEATERKAIPAAWRVSVRARQDHTCAACGVVFRYGWPIEYDHVIPIALGGEHAESNIEALCPRPCHLEKTKRDVKAVAKAKRVARKHFEGPRAAKRPIRSRGFG